MPFKVKKRYLIIFLLICVLVLANACLTMRTSDKKIIKNYKKLNQFPVIKYYSYQAKKIRYLLAEKYDINKPNILFVHGAPGSLDDFHRYLQDTDLRQKANLISVDRLGYGYSDFGNAEVSITKQANALINLTNTFQNKNTILVGWSYGGPIIVNMAMQQTNFRYLILLAPAISPTDEKYFWLGNFAKWKLTKWFVPTAFVIAEEEKLAHANELEKMDTKWHQIKTPITYYHGTKDRLVPFANMKYAKSKLTDSMLKTIPIKDGNHFIPFKEFELIKTELLSILKNRK